MSADPLLIDVPERLDGERTVLLAPRAGLGAEMAVVITQSLSHLRPWMPWAQDAPTAESSEMVVRRMQADFITRSDLCFQIYARKPDGSAGRLLGGTGLHRIDGTVRKFEIGYWIRTAFAGHGYATEAAQALTGAAFSLPVIARVEIRCDPANERSARIPSRLGFRHRETLLGETVTLNGTPRDTMIWELTREMRAR